MDEWLSEALEKLDKMPKEAKAIRERAKNELYFFAQLVNKGYCYGRIHKEIFEWLEDYVLYNGDAEDSSNNKLIMLPRAHLKSHIVATAVAWLITRHPEITTLYLSATSELAQTQLYAIQNILCSAEYQRYFPEYINPQEGKREKWSATKISIDHPKRALEAVRDATVSTAGLTTNTTGWHADLIVCDDIVVPENAYTEDGRDSVSKKVSQFTSIRNPGGFTLAAGTRYHPSDIYATWKDQMFDDYDDEGEFVGKKPVWQVTEHVVETDGVFLWPRTMRDDGKAYGFSKKILSRIRAEYSDTTQFYAQYYNNPNDPESERVDEECFRYYNPRMLSKSNNNWYINFNGEKRKLNVYAAVDFAYSLKKKADWSAIVVIGMDYERNIFVLDIDRFKADRIPIYYEHISDLHSQWRFTKLRAEVTAAQKVIVNGVKDKLRAENMYISIEEYRPTRQEGSKEQRMEAALEEPYKDGRVYHFEGGWTKALEEEVKLARPAHDDIKDALANAVCIARPPGGSGSNMKDFMSNTNKFNSRFGGVNFR